MSIDPHRHCGSILDLHAKMRVWLQRAEAAVWCPVPILTLHEFSTQSLEAHTPRTQCMEALLASSVPHCNFRELPIDRQLPGAKRGRLRGRLAIVELIGSPPRRDAGLPDAA
jgi:hypothetical protein